MVFIDQQGVMYGLFSEPIIGYLQSYMAEIECQAEQTSPHALMSLQTSPWAPLSGTTNLAHTKLDTANIVPHHTVRQGKRRPMPQCQK